MNENHEDSSSHTGSDGYPTGSDGYPQEGELRTPDGKLTPKFIDMMIEEAQAGDRMMGLPPDPLTLRIQALRKRSSARDDPGLDPSPGPDARCRSGADAGAGSEAGSGSGRGRGGGGGGREASPLPSEEIADLGPPGKRGARNRQVGIKMRTSEYDQLVEAAALYGATPSTFARMLVRRGVVATLGRE